MKKVKSTELGSIIKKMRTDKKMSQVELAKITNTSQPYISAVEKGTTISPDQFNHLAKHFGKRIECTTTLSLIDKGE